MINSALLFLNGDELPNNINFKYDIVVACNGGSKNAQKFRIKPDVLIGDMDSLDEDTKEFVKDCEIIRYLKEKDESDAELALEHIIERGFTEVCVIGAFGKRNDHSFTNIFLFSKYSEKIIITILSNNTYSTYLSSNHNYFKRRIKKNMLFSIIPLETCNGLSIKGAKYNLQDAVVSVGDTLTLSNEGIGEDTEIILKAGRAMIMILGLE